MERDLWHKLATRRYLQELPGNDCFKKNLLVLKGTQAIFYKNYFDWRRGCDGFRSVGDAILFNDAWRWRQQKTIIRLFHNLIVSFSSYSEHIKIFNKRMDAVPSFQKNIDGRYDVLNNEGMTCFIVVLRDMMVHRQVYPLISKGIQRRNPYNDKQEFYRFQSIHRNELESYINSRHRRRNGINIELLATEFLKKQPDDVDIELVISQHFNSLNNFHRETVFEYIYTFKNDLILFRDEVAEHLKNFNGVSPINKLQLRYLQFLLYHYERYTQNTI